jgi:CO dehydrogenase maturation factor
MKIAISGKGGVGKTTFAALLAYALADKGIKVLAVDADPDANLGQGLGFPGYESLVPVADMKEGDQRAHRGRGELWGDGDLFQAESHGA